MMGIINVTPDSFSDGGRFLEPRAALDQAQRLIDEGADLLDIGGESTRPYSTAIDVREELRRVTAVIEQIVQRSPVPVSIDTSKATVARVALDAGAEIINDVSAMEADEDMLPLALEAGVGVCLMHMRGTPQTMQDDPTYDEVTEEIREYLGRRRDAMLAAGMMHERICVDPGIGFGKTHQHNFTIMANCRALHELGCPLLVGHSRKGFLAKILGNKQADRTQATVGAALSLAVQGVQVIRVHDVQPVREAMLAFEATGGFADARTT